VRLLQLSIPAKLTEIVKLTDIQVPPVLAPLRDPRHFSAVPTCGDVFRT
jgi:hypothetical protein